MSRLNPEPPIDPPDAGISDREQRELDAAAGRGFDAMDERSRKWLCNELADTPTDIREIATRAIAYSVHGVVRVANLDGCVATLRDRYIAECSGDYYADAIDGAEYTMEER